MKHADKVKIRRALKIVKEAAGAISTIRALASQGVPGDVAGRWIAGPRPDRRAPLRRRGGH